MRRNWIASVMMVMLLGVAQAAYQELALEDGNVLPLEIYPADGDDLLLWLPAETGLKTEDRYQAQQLAKLGHEVWLADLFSAYFLPLGASSLDSIAADTIVQLIRKAGTQGKRVTVVAIGRAAIPALRGINAYQHLVPDADIRLLMLHPKLYEANPQPGSPARLMPVVEASDVTTFILQPDQSPWFWRLAEIRSGLEANGSEVYSWRLPGIRDRFWYRPDATAAEEAAAKQLPHYIDQALGLLYVLPMRVHNPGEIGRKTEIVGREDKQLQPYSGDPQPPQLHLPLLSGGEDGLARHRGEVVVVNFWASWCPPCVHEMPSMENINKKYKNKGLAILAVNMAEEPTIIRTFLKERVTISFNVLLDANGAALQRWKVFAFPTSYIVDRQGRIRYAVYGAIDWESADTIRKLEQLLRE